MITNTTKLMTSATAITMLFCDLPPVVPPVADDVATGEVLNDLSLLYLLVL